jgi:16S rRNA processing protein RimM
MAHAENGLIEIGHVLGAHGVQGQVKVFSNTSPRENIVSYSPWLIEHDGVTTSVQVTGNVQGKNVIARIDGVISRDQALDLSGARILIHKDQLPVLQDGDYYWDQLVGLQVINTSGNKLGYIHHMLETGANDVMVVKGDRERLIPYVMDDVVKNISLDTQQLIVDWEADF